MAVRLFRRREPEPAVRRDVARAALVVRPELVHTMAAAAAGAGRRETGGPLLGTVQRSWDGLRLAPLVSVLGTVPPGPAVEGRFSSVSLGRDGDGDRAAAALRWLRSATGLDLLHVGDWHVHPSGLCRPSAGDTATARAMRDACAAPVWLVAVAVSTTDSGEALTVEGEVARYRRERLETTEVRFYQALEHGLAAVPVRVEGHAIPRLPPLPWHVADPVRFAAECRLLDAAGFTTAIEAAPDGRPGLNLRLRRDGGQPLTILTGPGYPQQEPVVLDEGGRRVTARSKWSPDRFLVDLVREARR